LREEAKMSVRTALKEANDLKKPSIDMLFEDVYEKVPKHLMEQREDLKKHLRKYPEQYNLGNFVGGEEWPHSK
jgi:2-oxoisovalerate dehydrogenase E1 component alpha subunit